MQKLACSNAVEVRACYGDGTWILMHLGPEVPPSMNMCYFAKTGCRLVDAGDGYAMFAGASAVLEKMITEWKSPFSGDEISEAAQIANFIVNARPGEERNLA